ncbi:hypothetical protein M5K25_016588 [Dendrobium thyrsiflorum]|uniref:cinnamyl-alcohol dehydrogenase n=1 Tax=Dendrobium thyrsiflorum TaxID=117978 RepID=A0ABD0US87_DENTH
MAGGGVAMAGWLAGGGAAERRGRWLGFSGGWGGAGCPSTGKGKMAGGGARRRKGKGRRVGQEKRREIGEIDRMDKQDTPITVHLGRGARIQLANTVINTGSTGATIQFGSVDFSAITARTTVPRAHLPAPQITARDIPQGRISVFERLSQPETLTAKRIVDGRKVSVVTADTTALPRETVTSGIYDAEASLSGGKLNRRQRRKRNAELRAQQLSVPVHPSNIPAQELEATIPTQNGFSNLKWVKRNSSTGELKKSFWEQRREVPTPPKKKEPESLSARVYRVLRTVKEKGLTKKRFQRPLTADVRRTPPRERLSFTRVERRERMNNPLGEHRGVTPELHIRGSTTERSRWKGKQVWRPRPRRDDERKEREIDLGVTSGAASRRSASTNKQRQKWVQKKTHDDTCPDGRHLGEFSKGSRRSLTPPKKEVNFDRSPRVEEILIPNQEPEIHWRRRSEVQVQEEEYDDEDTMDVELVYMVSHIDDNDSDDEEDRRSQTREQARRRRRGARSVTSQSVRSSEEEGEEVEENPFAEETLTLAQMRRQMRRQMKEKDKEISHLNEKMTEMMMQMTTMMEMMQKATSVGPTPAQPINHAASIAPAKPPDPHVPQASGIKGTPEGGNEAVDNTRQREAYSISPFKLDKKKQVIYDQGVYNADKGKQPMQYEEKPKQVYTPSSQPKLVLGGNDKPRTFSGGGERPRQAMGTGDRTKESTRVVTSSSVPPPKEAIKEKSIQGEQWETVVSKKTTKMLKQLEGVPGVKWKSPTEPVLNLKWLPVPHASTFKQQPSQASSSKYDKKKAKSAKKKAKIKKPKEKKTATQRVIDSLGEYHQTARRPIKLGDFMIELKINEEEEVEDKVLPTETCRVISTISKISEREKYAEEAAPEFCLMVSSMDYSSEEDLYFPKEDDTDPDIATQMEQVNLENDSESTGESPDATMADSEENTASNKSESDEVAQVTIYEDAKYFVPKKLKSSSSLEAKASTSKTEKRPKQGGEMRQRGRKRVTPTPPKAAATSKTKRVVSHLGSDTEEDEIIPFKTKKNCQPTARGKKKAEDSDPDYDYESTYANSVQGIFSRRIDSLSVSDSVLVVTRIPLQHFKEVIPREVHNVEELVTFYVRPHKKKGGPGRLFYSVGKLNEEENRDWYRRIIDSGELLPTRLPRFNTKGIRRMLRKQINIPTSKRQLCFCLSIWYGRHPRPLRQKDAAARRGLGFIVQKHEIVGVVTAISTGVAHFKVGDIVGVGTYINSCRTCEYCNSDKENKCAKGATYTFNGIDTDGTITKGGYSSYIVVHQRQNYAKPVLFFIFKTHPMEDHYIKFHRTGHGLRYCFKIPDGYPPELAAPLLCAGITVYAPIIHHNMNQPGKSLGVIGLGGLGHMAVKYGKAFGLKVVVFSTSIYKMEEALEILGADEFVLSSDEQQMQAFSNSLDFIIDTSSGPHPFEPYMSLLKTEGTLVLVGFPGEIRLSPATLILGSKTITGSVVGGTKDIKEMLEFSAANKIYPKIELIPITYVNEALDRLVKRDVKYRFVIDIENSLK